MRVFCFRQLGLAFVFMASVGVAFISFRESRPLNQDSSKKATESARCLNCQEIVMRGSCRPDEHLSVDESTHIKCENLVDLKWKDVEFFGPVDLIALIPKPGRNALPHYTVQGPSGSYARYRGEYFEVTPLIFSDPQLLDLSPIAEDLKLLRKDLNSAFYIWQQEKALAQLTDILARKQTPTPIGVRIFRPRVWRGCQLDQGDQITRRHNAYILSRNNRPEIQFRIGGLNPSDRICDDLKNEH